MSNYSVSEAEHMFNQHSYPPGTHRESSLLHHPNNIRSVPLGPLGRRHCLPSLKPGSRHVIPAPHVSCSAHGGGPGLEPPLLGGEIDLPTTKALRTLSKPSPPNSHALMELVHNTLLEGEEPAASGKWTCSFPQQPRDFHSRGAVLCVVLENQLADLHG